LNTNLGGADFGLLLVDSGIVFFHRPDLDHDGESAIGGRGLREEEEGKRWTADGQTNE
jgi:hypothetical protein